jgi:hypothetical protein
MNNNINFKELRLDNYICINNNLHPCRVKEITMSSVVVESIKENYIEPTINSINPIPLTEEWLLKMGGKKVNNLDWCIMFGGIEFYCRYNKFWYCSIGSVYLSDRIQFVHQAQNLYFSITNQELTMK